MFLGGVLRGEIPQNLLIIGCVAAWREHQIDKMTQ